MNKDKVAKFLARLRKEHKLTQEQLSEILCVDRSVISKWERCEYLPDAETLLKIANYYNISVNEIVVGDYINEDNKDEIDLLPITIINNNKKKLTKIIISMLLIFILLFLGIYFYYNFNSIKVYTLNGDSDNFNTYNGLFIVSKEKVYININSIDSINNKVFNYYELYYIKDNNKYNIVKSYDLNYIVINNFKNNEYFSYKDIDIVINNLYIDIYYDDEYDTIKLNFKKDFVNNKLFYFNYIDNNNNLDINNTEYKYINKYFTYDKDNNYYIYKHKYNSYDIVETYDDYNKIYEVKFNKDNENKYSYVYHIYNNIIYYYDYKKIIYQYDYNNKKCIDKICEKNIKNINDFITSFLDIFLDK